MIVEVIRDPPAKPLLQQLARLHCEEIADGFMTRLGPQFLQVLYYGLALSRESFVVVARDSADTTKIKGFICGSTNTGAAYREVLLRVGLKLAVYALPKLVSFRNIYRALETFRYPAQKSDIDLPSAEVLNFCVDSDGQGRGIGRELFREFNDEQARRGVERIRIVTGENQRRAQEFYRAAGASQVATLEVHSGSSSIVFTFDTRGQT